MHKIIKVIVAAAGRKISGAGSMIRTKIFGSAIHPQSFLCRVHIDGGSVAGKRSLADYYRKRQGLVFPHDLSWRHELFVQTGMSGKSSEVLLAKANSICSHTFNLLGSGAVNLGEKIDWHVDFKTGYRWNPMTYFRNVKIPYGKADIKVPWEISRFQHAALLGEAYMLTGDEKYVREFVLQAGDWIDSNRMGFGVNWMCTMDVAIRACNWIAAYSFFRESMELNDAFMLKLLNSLYEHGLHIRANLEYSERFTSNHYLANIAGLIYLGVLFPEFREAAAWRDFGARELVREMEKQVYPDGCDFEASTCYHCLVIELIFFPTMVLVVNGQYFSGQNYRDAAENIFGAHYTKRLYKMFEAVLYLLKPNGKMPQIGDNDSGRLHIFTEREALDMRYLLTLGAIFFREPMFKVSEFGFCEEALWVFGERGYEIWKALESQGIAEVKSKAFPDAGWYVMRNNKDYMVVSCGPNGQNSNGGHAHNDKLSFELCLNGIDIVIDPGTFLYTPDPDERNVYRSTLYHNTVGIDGIEQNRMPEGSDGLFRLPDEARANALIWETSDRMDIFAGEHYGYQSRGIIHRRCFEFYKDEGIIVIHDELAGAAMHAGTAYFHFYPGLDINVRHDGIFNAGNACFEFHGASGIELSDYFFSMGYGVRTHAKMLAVRFTASLRTEIRKAHG